MTRIFTSVCAIALLVILVPKVNADDIGITSVRLIQVSDTSYVFEADLNQVLLWTIKEPVFPERFKVSEMQYENNAGWIIARVTVSTSGEPLNYKDEIFLPWMRNGVSLAAQWQDGTLGRGFFRRSLEGIYIPMNAIMPVEKLDWEIATESFGLGIKHIGLGYIHLLLVLALFVFSRGKSVFNYLLWYAFGQGFSVILLDFGVPGFDLLFTEILILLMVLMLVTVAIRNKSFPLATWLLLALGLLHGLSVSKELVVINPAFDQKLIAVFMFDLAVDLVQFGAALLVVQFFKFFELKANVSKAMTYVLGTLAVALMLGIFNQKVLTGETEVVQLEEDQNLSPGSMMVGEAGASQNVNRPQGAAVLTAPIMSYLSVEPFEVRHEILINAGAALELIGEGNDRTGSIPEAVQEGLKARVLKLFENSNTMEMDGNTPTPVLTSIDFVTLGPTGVFIRAEPMRESPDEGILGITLVYETETLAKNIDIEWDLFIDAAQHVEATTVDPFGGTTLIITPEENMLSWEASLSGYTVPQVEEVAIESPRVAMPSLAMLLVAIGLLIFAGRWNMKKEWAFLIIALALVLYPFVRPPLDIDFIKQWKPSNERSAGIISSLLTNVYRSFDYRKESDVYDRLAISVMGNQLTETYIQQRRGLEIENRGGAKAKVSDVEVLEVYHVEKGVEDEYGIDVGWIVNGSVSHFGHMHYRQNRYRAVVWITPEDGNWKIERMEILDEERLM